MCSKLTEILASNSLYAPHKLPCRHKGLGNKKYQTKQQQKQKTLKKKYENLQPWSFLPSDSFRNSKFLINNQMGKTLTPNSQQVTVRFDVRHLVPGCFFHNTRSLYQGSTGQKRRPTHCSCLRGINCPDSVLRYRIKQSFHPVKTGTEREKRVRFVICHDRRWNRGSWLPFKVVVTYSLP